MLVPSVEAACSRACAGALQDVGWRRSGDGSLLCCETVGTGGSRARARPEARAG